MENFILTGIICILVVLIISIISKHVIANKTINLSLLELQLKTPITPHVVEILDEFIQECFDDYMFLNGQYAMEDRYISDDEEKQITTDIVTIVSDRISSTLYKQLSVYYNEKVIPIIISNKIYELVVLFVTKKNQAKSKPVDK